MKKSDLFCRFLATVPGPKIERVRDALANGRCRSPIHRRQGPKSAQLPEVTLKRPNASHADIDFAQRTCA